MYILFPLPLGFHPLSFFFFFFLHRWFAGNTWDFPLSNAGADLERFAPISGSKPA
jgi:hypothetical protein